AEVASETKSAFLANMSHEIRTPLGAVLGFSELMLNQDMTNAERVNSIEVIKRNGRLLSNIINDILDLSKVEAGKLEIEKVNLPISEVMGEISSLLSLEAVEKGIKLSVEAEGLLPTFVKTDSLRLRQVLLNIVGNAIKFTQRGSVEVKVKLLQTGSEPKKLAFVIRDTGEGIPSEQAEKLFSPFTQADVSTTRRFGGTGLGLVLSKRLASALGGDVILSESVPGKGSTFIVTIDPGQSELIEYREHDVNEPLVSRTPKVVREVDLSRLKVLIVDDSPDNQALITKLLRLAGASVKTASNGRLGVEMATSEDFSLILMDLQMPEMDGYEATRLLRENGYDKPIIALTAHAMKEERKKCLESGFSEHLTKPIDRTLLLNALAQFSA
ncbi:MAG: response regulator, partial [Bdellovibrionota bacterium]